MLKVIFVCSGNICRSPMAERIFASRARAAGVPAFALSMGTLDIEGQPAARHAVTVSSEVDVDLSAHRSQGIKIGMLRMASHVFVMEHEHVRTLKLHDSGVAAKAILMGRYDTAGGGEEIDDPVNQQIEAFRVCRDRIVRAVDAFLAEQKIR